MFIFISEHFQKNSSSRVNHYKVLEVISNQNKTVAKKVEGKVMGVKKILAISGMSILGFIVFVAVIACACGRYKHFQLKYNILFNLIVHCFMNRCLLKFK